MTEWITWTGGPMPVPSGTIIEVMYRSRKTFREPAGQRYSECWVRFNLDTDIIKYRIIDKETKMQPTIQELKDQLNTIQLAIEAMENTKQSKPWPTIGDVYWYVDAYNDCNNHTWDDDHVDNGFYSQGNCFRSKEDADQELHARRTIHAIRHQPGRVKFILGDEQYGILVKHDSCETTLWTYHMGSFAQTYFDTSDDCRAAINAVGKENIIKAVLWLANKEY